MADVDTRRSAGTELELLEAVLMEEAELEPLLLEAAVLGSVLVVPDLGDTMVLFGFKLVEVKPVPPRTFNASPLTVVVTVTVTVSLAASRMTSRCLTAGPKCVVEKAPVLRSVQCPFLV